MYTYQSCIYHSNTKVKFEHKALSFLSSQACALELRTVATAKAMPCREATLRTNSLWLKGSAPKELRSCSCDAR